MPSRAAITDTAHGTGQSAAAYGRKFHVISTGGDAAYSIQLSLDNSAWADHETSITENTSRIVGPFARSLYCRISVTTHTSGSLTTNIMPYPEGLIGD